MFFKKKKAPPQKAAEPAEPIEKNSINDLRVLRTSLFENAHKARQTYLDTSHYLVCDDDGRKYLSELFDIYLKIVKIIVDGKQECEYIKYLHSREGGKK